MVQIIQMEEPTSAWANFGAGLGKGMAGSAKMMVNQKLNDMLTQKQSARQHSEWFNQGEQIAKFEPDKTKRAMIRDTIAAVGPESYFKMQDRLGIQNMEALMSSGFGTAPAAETPKSPQARQSMVETRDYTPEGLMSSTGQGTGQIQAPPMIAQRQPSIQQQEMLNAQQTQAQNSQLMANAVAPNIQAIPESQKVQQEQEKTQAPAANKNWIRDASEEEFNRALMGVPQSERQAYRNYRLQSQRAGVEKEKFEYKKAQEKKESETKISEPYLKSIEEKRASTRDQAASLNLAEQSIKNRSDSTILTQFFADKFGFDPMLDENSSLLKTSSKEFILGSLRRAGSRPNMWIEQQIGNMFPTIGKSRKANLSVVEALKFDNDVNRKEVEIADRLSDQYKEQFGYVPSEISKKVDQELRPYLEKRRDELATKLQEIKEMEMSAKQLSSLKAVQEGTPLTRARGLAILEKADGDVKKALQLARKMGYKVPENGE